MTWVIPHPDAAGTLYNASDDYRWFRLVVGFQKGVCFGINTGYSPCGGVYLELSGNGQFENITASSFIRETDDTVLQNAGDPAQLNKIAMAFNVIAGSRIYRRFASSDANYKYAAIFADIRTCWRIGQALSKLTIKAEARIQSDFAGGSTCSGCADVYVPWQTDWISADFTNIISIGSGNTTLSRSTSLTTLFEFDMDPDGAAI